MSFRAGFIAGLAGAIAARKGLMRLLGLRFQRDVKRLNDGDHGPLLSAYAEDAVLHFNEGPHRWSGEHRGKAAIDRFLRNFTRAGIHGEIREMWIGGPPWALNIAVRFDDWAEDPAGAPMYANRTFLLVRTRWGRIVEQEDFYEDTTRITALEKRLRELGVQAAPGPAA